MRIRDMANATKIKLTMSFLVFFAIDENIVAPMAAIKPTIRFAPSPPVSTKNKTTKRAPADAPTRSAAYSLPATDPKALNAADIIIPMKKNGTEKRAINNGR
jgi:hypothetical protein